ncbi:MAG TPA: fumarylacetoacetate hydrolase family protein [Polyangiales bacterium]|nr:fumarylacetoacetate hydrolase family protein [Polyangiales bacterium]
MIDIAQHGDALYSALRERRTLSPLTDREPGITIDHAYQISRHLLARRLRDGERVVGKKTGVTNKVVQVALGVDQPDFGYLTDAMSFEDGAELPISTLLIAPRAEGEIAFVLERDLVGPGVSASEVLAATAYVQACFEIVDSRIADWKIRIQDTIADNASSGMFVLGSTKVPPRGVDFVTCGMVVWKNGELLSTGAGAAALGSPLNAVAWLANTLGERGEPLRAGEVILSGSLVPLEPVRAGDRMELRIAGIGEARVRFG